MERDKAFGRPFLDDLLISIIEGSIGPSASIDARAEVNRRLVDARAALFGSRNKAGRPEEDDDFELLQVAYWYNYLHGEPKLAVMLAEGPVEPFLSQAVKMEARGNRGRGITLKRKFQKEFNRIMAVMDDSEFSENLQHHDDLIKIQRILEKHGVKFNRPEIQESRVPPGARSMLK